MPLARRLYRGCKVWVDVDEQGRLVESGRGRTTIRYRPDGPESYTARVEEIAELPEQAPVPPASAASRGAAGSPDSAADGASVPSAAGAPDPASAATASRPKPRRTRKAATAPRAPRSAAAGVEPIVIYTDGACFGNPGPAGVGVLLEWKGRTKELSRFLGQGTNNIAELTAIEVALQQVKNRTLPVRVHSDSAYAIGVLSEGWKAKLNRELIARVQALMREFTDLRLVKVRGHAGDPRNERVDQLARDAILRGA